VEGIAARGGFWHVVENIIKRPTVNPNTLKSKFIQTIITITTKRPAMTLKVASN
jgi:hypothetical protein